MQPAMFDGVAERTGQHFLASYVFESLGAPFARDYLVGHYSLRNVSSLLVCCLARSRQFGPGILLQQFPRDDQTAVGVLAHNPKRDQHV